MKLIIVAAALLIAARRDEKEDLANAAKKTVEAKSYTFKGQTEIEMPAMMGGMGGGDPTKFEGKHETGVGTLVKTDTHEFVIVGENAVTRPRSEWKKVETDDDPMAMQKNMMKMFGGSQKVKTPHEDLAGFAKKLDKTKKKEAKEKVGEVECDLYDADLTEDAAKEWMEELLPMGKFMQQIPDVTFTAKAKVWVDKDGRIVKYVSSGTMSASIQGQDFEMSATKTVNLSDVDATKVEIPEEAKKAMKE